MTPGSVSPLVFVPDSDDLDNDDATHALVCPFCWNVTGAWLASPYDTEVHRLSRLLNYGEPPSALYHVHVPASVAV
jgi:hypothetical protein